MIHDGSLYDEQERSIPSTPLSPPPPKHSRRFQHASSASYSGNLGTGSSQQGVVANASPDEIFATTKVNAFSIDSGVVASQRQQLEQQRLAASNAGRTQNGDRQPKDAHSSATGSVTGAGERIVDASTGGGCSTSHSASTSTTTNTSTSTSIGQRGLDRPSSKTIEEGLARPASHAISVSSSSTTTTIQPASSPDLQASGRLTPSFAVDTDRLSLNTYPREPWAKQGKSSSGSSTTASLGRSSSGGIGGGGGISNSDGSGSTNTSNGSDTAKPSPAMRDGSPRPRRPVSTASTFYESGPAADNGGRREDEDDAATATSSFATFVSHFDSTTDESRERGWRRELKSAESAPAPDAERRWREGRGGGAGNGVRDDVARGTRAHVGGGANATQTTASSSSSGPSRPLVSAESSLTSSRFLQSRDSAPAPVAPPSSQGAGRGRADTEGGQSGVGSGCTAEQSGSTRMTTADTAPRTSSSSSSAQAPASDAIVGSPAAETGPGGAPGASGALAVTAARQGRRRSWTESAQTDQSSCVWGANFWVVIEQPNGQGFFANPETGHCAWAVPAGTIVLPPGQNGQWWELYDATQKLPYYFHTRTRETRWERPRDSFVIPMAAIQASAAGRRFSRTEFGHESLAALAAIPSHLEGRVRTLEALESAVPYRERKLSSQRSLHARSQELRDAPSARPSSRQPAPPTDSPRRRRRAASISATEASPGRAPKPSSGGLSSPPSPHVPMTISGRSNAEVHLEPSRRHQASSLQASPTRRKASNPPTSRKDDSPSKGWRFRASLSPTTAGPNSFLLPPGQSVDHGADGSLDLSTLSSVDMPRPYRRERDPKKRHSAQLLSSPTAHSGRTGRVRWQSSSSVAQKRSSAASTLRPGGGVGELVSPHRRGIKAKLRSAPPTPGTSSPPSPLSPESDVLATPPLTASSSLGSSTLPPQPSYETYARSHFAVRRSGPFKLRRVPVERMARWQRTPIVAPLLPLSSEELAVDAVRTFKIIQRICGDREESVLAASSTTTTIAAGQDASQPVAPSGEQPKQAGEPSRARRSPRRSYSEGALDKSAAPKPGDTDEIGSEAALSMASRHGKHFCPPGFGDSQRPRRVGLTLLEEQAWVLERGFVGGAEMRDEIYAQTMKQLTRNPRAASEHRGWTWMCCLVMCFAPSSRLYPHLRAFIDEYATHVTPVIKQGEWGRDKPEELPDPEAVIALMARHCLSRLELIRQRGPRSRLPTLSEIRCFTEAAFNPSVFGQTLETIVARQRETYPEVKVPVILPFLADAMLTLGAPRVYGVFRTPGNPALLSELRVRIERGHYSLAGLMQRGSGDDDEHVHVLASLFRAFLRELEEPLIPSSHYADCLAASTSPSRSIEAALALPPIHLAVCRFVVSFLQLFLQPDSTSRSELNADQLALVFAPAFFRHELAFDRLAASDDAGGGGSRDEADALASPGEAKLSGAGVHFHSEDAVQMVVSQNRDEQRFLLHLLLHMPADASTSTRKGLGLTQRSLPRPWAESDPGWSRTQGDSLVGARTASTQAYGRSATADAVQAAAAASAASAEADGAAPGLLSLATKRGWRSSKRIDDELDESGEVSATSPLPRARGGFSGVTTSMPRICEPAHVQASNAASTQRNGGSEALPPSSAPAATSVGGVSRRSLSAHELRAEAPWRYPASSWALTSASESTPSAAADRDGASATRRHKPISASSPPLSMAATAATWGARHGVA